MVKGEIEQKYVFMREHKDTLLEWLSHVLIPAPQFSVGSVFSIYYDTPVLDLYYEKRHSDYLKSKVRLRWYTDACSCAPDHPVPCYVELKRKTGVLRQKIRTDLSLTPGALTINPFSDVEILQAPSRLYDRSCTDPGALVPMVLVQYERCRFLDPQTGSSIALDSNIQCTHANEAYIIGSPPIALDVGVLEIKGTHRHCIDSLAKIGSYLTREAFSKYARCIEHLMLPLSRRI